MSKVFIIGGPGGISRGTVDYLLEHNYKVGIFTHNSQEKKKKIVLQEMIIYHCLQIISV